MIAIPRRHPPRGGAGHPEPVRALAGWFDTGGPIPRRSTPSAPAPRRAPTTTRQTSTTPTSAPSPLPSPLPPATRTTTSASHRARRPQRARASAATRSRSAPTARDRRAQPATMASRTSRASGRRRVAARSPTWWLLEPAITAPDEQWEGANPDFSLMDGTSFSTPHVGGGLALLFGAGITDPRLAKAILINSARDFCGAHSEQPDPGPRLWAHGNVSNDMATRRRLGRARPDPGLGGARQRHGRLGRGRRSALLPRHGRSG